MKNNLPQNCIGKKLNQPFKSNRKFKKLQTCVKDESGKIKNIHFGDTRYKDFTQHKDKERRKSFRARHKCNSLTKKDKATARYQACEVLW